MNDRSTSNVTYVLQRNLLLGLCISIICVGCVSTDSKVSTTSEVNINATLGLSEETLEVANNLIKAFSDYVNQQNDALPPGTSETTADYARRLEFTRGRVNALIQEQKIIENDAGFLELVPSAMPPGLARDRVVELVQQVNDDRAKLYAQITDDLPQLARAAEEGDGTRDLDWGTEDENEEIFGELKSITPGYVAARMAEISRNASAQ